MVIPLLSLQPAKWTEDELHNTNTAQDASYLTTLEKEAILYLNLARHYPKKYLEKELNSYSGPRGYTQVSMNNSYRKSLERTLRRMQPTNVIHPDSTLYMTAKCMRDEQGPTNRIGHSRKRCKKSYRAECISYGMKSGKEVTMQLLIDTDVPSLGHRKACLSPFYTRIGIKHGHHGRYETMTVLDFN